MLNYEETKEVTKENPPRSLPMLGGIFMINTEDDYDQSASLIRITPRLMNFEDNQEGKSSSFSLVLRVILSHRLRFLVAMKVPDVLHSSISLEIIRTTDAHGRHYNRIDHTERETRDCGTTSGSPGRNAISLYACYTFSLNKENTSKV
ncbi:hypothetical protein V1478_008784 [Vespula squamosa]|uniref:Uncharacterized protein n=1 Tax=Vespula squamosa TaxID=30214 RepID=A0ABD2AUI9_VESSQ